MATAIKQYAEQYYVFTGPDGWAWVEMFCGTTHVTAPGPCRSIADQIELLKELHPNALVDELLVEDIPEAMRFAN